jgi:hypothetical protein
VHAAALGRLVLREQPDFAGLAQQDDLVAALQLHQLQRLGRQDDASHFVNHNHVHNISARGVDLAYRGGTAG